jgi:hypothetical protein
MPTRGIRISAMSIRISEGGRLFAILAGLGGAAMIVSAGLAWTRVVLVTRYYTDVSRLRGTESLAMFVLGLFVVAGVVCFVVLGSRRLWMTAGALVVLAAAAGIVIAFRSEPRLAGFEPPCPPAPCIQTSEGSGRVLAGLGAGFAAGYGGVALLRSGGEAARAPAVGRSPAVWSGPTPSGDSATPPKRRMSDASLLALTVVAIVIAVVVGFFLVVQQICSEPGEWC